MKEIELTITAHIDDDGNIIGRMNIPAHLSLLHFATLIKTTEDCLIHLIKSANKAQAARINADGGASITIGELMNVCVTPLITENHD